MILFYTSVPRSFRTTLVGHLYEIANRYPVVLLSEKLDEFTERIVSNKKLFPKLEKIIPVSQHTGDQGLLNKNQQLAQLAKDLVKKYKPKIVIAANDMYLFEMYLMRVAKKAGAINIAIQAGLSAPPGQAANWVVLGEAVKRFPQSLPLPLKLFLIKARKTISHFLYYWFLPLLNFQKPFFGRSSFTLIKGESGMRDADYQTVFNEQQYEFYSQAGVPKSKLLILPHPLITNKKFFDNFLSLPFQTKIEEKQKIVLLLLSGDIEVTFRKTLSPIPTEKKMAHWKKIIQAIKNTLPEWQIIISTHPATKNFTILKREFESISPQVKMLELNGPVEEYMKGAEIIVGLPPSLSTLLFTASLQYPKKPILSLDPQGELMGDYYKDFPGIDYISSKIELEEKLKLIRSSKYKKQVSPPAGGLTEEGFKNMVELIEHISSLS